jgi:S-adenosylmethionine:tRNA ribosyltransferase-isomerase
MKYTSVEEFDYHLPEERIAQHPVMPRDSSKLLVFDPASNAIQDDHFYHLANHLKANDLLVFNNTKVIPARMHFVKETGAHIEVFLLQPLESSPIEQILESTIGQSDWHCMIGNLKKWKDGDILRISENLELQAELLDREKKQVRLIWKQGESLATQLEKAGKIPLPPYIKRKSDATDQERYQTVYAVEKGAVAAPTAGLHFTVDTFEQLNEKGVLQCPVTLHVGAGTFKPVSTDNVFEHDMHQEVIVVQKSSVERIRDAERRIAVGTTSLRTLETLYWVGVKLERKEENPLHIEQEYAYQNNAELDYSEALNRLVSYMIKEGLNEIQLTTAIMITPHYKVRSIDGIITNFHLPKSTLIMLIASLVGKSWRNIYEHALSKNYRFLSYGDSSLLYLK